MRQPLDECINETEARGKHFSQKWWFNEMLSGIEECIRNITFSFDETLMHGSLGSSSQVDLRNVTLWSSTVPNLFHGLCHTLYYPSLVAADMMRDAVYLSLHTNLREAVKVEIIKNILKFPFSTNF